MNETSGNENVNDAEIAESTGIESQKKPIPELAPVGQADRIQMLDVLRGFAILGILMPNIQAFSMIATAYSNPLAYGDLNGANFHVWYVTHLLFEQKFMSLFSMMFGAGIALMTMRADQKKHTGLWKVHYRRMAWLLLFGLLHAHIFWYGDILFCYAVAGCGAFLLRRWNPRTLVIIGVLANGVASLAFFGLGIAQSFAPESMQAQFELQWQPNEQMVQAELDAYRGGWLDQVPYRSQMSLMVELMIVPLAFAWRAGGLMLIGIALFKWGFITGQASAKKYLIAIAVAVCFALPVVAWEIQANFNHDWNYLYTQTYGIQANYWVAPLVSIGYMSMIALLCRVFWLEPVRKILACVGQMAFTNYLGQTIICTTLFYGHGFGWYGHLERSEQFLVVLSVWAFQLVVSPIWLHFFRSGPAEWVWRSLTYWKIQPLLR